MTAPDPDRLAPQGYYTMWDAYGWAQVYESQGDFPEARRSLSLALNALKLATGSYGTAYAVLQEVKRDCKELDKIRGISYDN